MSDTPKAKRTFNSEDEMWAYIEEQEEILNRLDDVFAKVQKKPNQGIDERPAPFRETERLAMEGDPVSQFKLSIAYAKGEGTLQDSKQAAYWMMRAAENGQAPAQYNAGCYWRDHATNPDIHAAHGWFLKAAKQNFGPAQFNLGILYGNMKNFVAAYAWFQLAEQNRVEQAKENREKAAAFLTKDELNDARLSASAWMMEFRKQNAG